MKTSFPLNPIWRQVAAPILGLVAACSVGACLLFWNLSAKQDRAFEQDSALLVRSAIAGQQRALANSVLDFAIWNDAYESVSRSDQAWLEENFVSSVADAIVVFNLRAEVRYVWLAEEDDADGESLGRAVVQAAGNITDLLQAAAAAAESDRAVSRYAIIDGRLALLSIAAIGLEQDTVVVRGRGPTTDFVACVDFVDDIELGAQGATLGLQQMAFRPAPYNDRSPEMLYMPLVRPDGYTIGDVVWLNERPGTAGFAGQIIPILIGLFLLGALALWVARRLAARQIEVMAREEAALEASRVKTDFIAAMSHELRTPLNAIIGYSELIQEELVAANLDANSVRGDALKISTAGRHLLKLVNDILQHSKIDADCQPVSLTDVDVACALAETIDVVAPLAKSNGVSLDMTVDEDAQIVEADATLVAQCLINLAGNAAKFTRKGAVRLHARRAMLPQGAFVAIDVIDNGIGIDKEALGRLFAPFQQANDSIAKEFSGAGLGLSITRKLARAMGGDVTVVSELGRGSTFTLLLPEAARSRIQRAA